MYLELKLTKMPYTSVKLEPHPLDPICRWVCIIGAISLVIIISHAMYIRFTDSHGIDISISEYQLKADKIELQKYKHLSEVQSRHREIEQRAIQLVNQLSTNPDLATRMSILEVISHQKDTMVYMCPGLKLLADAWVNEVYVDKLEHIIEKSCPEDH